MVDVSMDIGKIEIRASRGHYEAYYENRFLCSGDTYSECQKEIDELDEFIDICRNEKSE